MGWLSNTPKWVKGPVTTGLYLAGNVALTVVFVPVIAVSLWVHNYFIAKKLDDGVEHTQYPFKEGSEEGRDSTAKTEEA